MIQVPPRSAANGEEIDARPAPRPQSESTARTLHAPAGSRVWVPSGDDSPPTAAPRVGGGRRSCLPLRNCRSTRCTATGHGSRAGNRWRCVRPECRCALRTGSVPGRAPCDGSPGRGAAGARQGVRTTRVLDRVDRTTVEPIPATAPVRHGHRRRGGDAVRRVRGHARSCTRLRRRSHPAARSSSTGALDTCASGLRDRAAPAREPKPRRRPSPQQVGSTRPASVQDRRRRVAVRQLPSLDRRSEPGDRSCVAGPQDRRRVRRLRPALFTSRLR